MKLYTEEQVRDLLRGVWTYTPTQIDNLMDVMHPIELPSDEEIEYAYRNHATFTPPFIAGAEFVIKKIQGGNNEQQ